MQDTDVKITRFPYSSIALAKKTVENYMSPADMRTYQPNAAWEDPERIKHLHELHKFPFIESITK